MGNRFGEEEYKAVIVVTYFFIHLNDFITPGLFFFFRLLTVVIRNREAIKVLIMMHVVSEVNCEKHIRRMRIVRFSHVLLFLPFECFISLGREIY